MSFETNLQRALGIALVGVGLAGCVIDAPTPRGDVVLEDDDGSEIGVAFGETGTIQEALVVPGMCSPCARNSDCGAGAYCLRNTSTGARFCGSACASDSDCPSDARCYTLSSTVRQCAPRSGTCPASSSDAGAPQIDAGTDAGVSVDSGVPVDSGAGRDAGPATGTGCADPVVVEELRLTNEARRAAGVGTLACDERLLAVALAHSRDMCERMYFSHTNPEGQSPFDRMTAAGITYRAAGENIAMGQPTAAAVHDAWMNSSGHRANIVNGSFGRIGIGHHVCSGGRHYWTQAFTN